jgi:hypothetical protein
VSASGTQLPDQSQCVDHSRAKYLKDLHFTYMCPNIATAEQGMESGYLIQISRERWVGCRASWGYCG